MIVASLLVLCGLFFGVVAVEAWELRLSGVIVVPLLAVYTLYNVGALAVFGFGVLVAYAGLSVLQRRTLLYGRALLLAAIALGALVPIASLSLPSLLGAQSLLSEVTFVGSVLPGIAAYNYHRLDGKRRIEDVLASLVVLAGLLVLGGLLVNPTTAAAIGSATPPVLFRAAADIAVVRNAVVTTANVPSVVAPLAELLALLAGGAVSELVYVRWGVRISGLIAVPLLVLFGFVHAAVVPVYLVVTALVYGLITLFNRASLLYGRVLLSTALAFAIVLTIPIALYGPAIPGTILLFTTVLAGIGAYNAHRVSPAERGASIALSAGLFVCLCGVLVPIATPAPIGVPSVIGTAHVASGFALCVLAAAVALRFERRYRLGAGATSRVLEASEQ